MASNFSSDESDFEEYMSNTDGNVEPYDFQPRSNVILATTPISESSPESESSDEEEKRTGNTDWCQCRIAAFACPLPIFPSHSCFNFSSFGNQ